jgi:hypothetical protein
VHHNKKRPYCQSIDNKVALQRMDLPSNFVKPNQTNNIAWTIAQFVTQGNLRANFLGFPSFTDMKMWGGLAIRLTCHEIFIFQVKLVS